jgi:hypothetical protein
VNLEDGPADGMKVVECATAKVGIKLEGLIIDAREASR